MQAGILPTNGGWLDQPLGILAHLHAIHVTERAWKNYRDDEYDWNEFTPTEQALVLQVEKWMVEEDALEMR